MAILPLIILIRSELYCTMTYYVHNVDQQCRSSWVIGFLVCIKFFFRL
jgi:hypothetical protein